MDAACYALGGKPKVGDSIVILIVVSRVEVVTKLATVGTPELSDALCCL